MGAEISLDDMIIKKVNRWYGLILIDRASQNKLSRRKSFLDSTASRSRFLKDWGRMSELNVCIDLI